MPEQPTTAETGALGVEAKDDTPEEFAAFMKQDTERYAKVVKVSGAKID